MGGYSTKQEPHKNSFCSQILLCLVSSVNYQERQRTQSGAVGLKFDSLISTYNPGQRRDSTQYDRTERIAFVEVDLSAQIASNHDRVNNQARSLKFQKL